MYLELELQHKFVFVVVVFCWGGKRDMIQPITVIIAIAVLLITMAVVLFCFLKEIGHYLY